MCGVRVLTLNIWNMLGDWAARRPEVLTWMDRLAPDVVCLQEVVDDGQGRNQAEWLAEQGGGWHVAFDGTPVPLSENGRFGNAILSRQPITETHTGPLPFEERADDTSRIVLHARCGDVDVFCTHLNWRYDDGYIRELQVQALADFVAQHSADDSRLPPIIGGDFNAEPDSTEIRFLTGNHSLGGRSVYFQDAWRVAGGGGSGWTWDNRNSFAAAEFEPDRRIDYVFVGWRRSRGRGRVESARVACDRALTGTFASDHFGLVVDIAD